MKPSFSYSEVMKLLDLLTTEKEFKALNFILTDEMPRYACGQWFEIRMKMSKRINQLLR